MNIDRRIKYISTLIVFSLLVTLFPKVILPNTGIGSTVLADAVEDSIEAEKYCEPFYYVVQSNDTAKIVGFNSSLFMNGGDLIVPSALDGHRVDIIANGAINDTNTFNSIKFEEGVRIIEDRAFYRSRCGGTIEFPNSLEKIGSEAFYMNTRLKGITIPPTVKSVGSHAFYLCALCEVTYYDSTSVASDAFEMTKSQTMLHYGGGDTPTPTNTNTPTPTNTNTPTPTNTNTPTPTKTNTPTPTNTNTPTPTNTNTPTPTNTNTPTPTNTNTPTPTNTNTPTPTNTNTPTPTNTNTPTPTNTNTPTPTNTNTPTPTNTVSPVPSGVTPKPDTPTPTNTNTPTPTNTNTPTPTNTNTPTPTNTNTPTPTNTNSPTPTNTNTPTPTNTSTPVPSGTTPKPNSPSPANTNTPTPTNSPTPVPDVPGPNTEEPVPPGPITEEPVSPEPISPKPDDPEPVNPDPGDPKDPDPVPADPDPTDGASFKDFIERLYVVALGREAEEDGVNYWMKQVSENGFTGADCARFFLLESPEFMNRNLPDDVFIATLYQTFFGRESDEAGMSYWLGRLASGATKADLVNDFIESVEWCNICASYGIKSGAEFHKATIPSKNAVMFATRLYTCCLGRDPEEDGLNYWALALTNLEASGYQAASLFFTLPEFVGLNTTNEEYLMRLYTTFMGREPEADGFNYWLGLLNNGSDRVDIMKAFAGCPEFAEICNEYGMIRGEII